MHHHEFDWAAMADTLEVEGDVYSPYLHGAFDQLKELTPQRILDVGSGPGVAASLLAQRFADAEVVAVDGSPELLQRAEQRAERLGVRLRTQVAEFPSGLADLPEADLIWSSHVMHHVGDQLDALSQLVARLCPGGVLAIAEGGLPNRWLPRDIGIGRPGLQSRLDAAMTAGFNQMRADLPDSVAIIEDWPAMLRTVGLVDVHSRTFLVDHPAPLADGPRQAIRRSLERHVDGLADLLDPDDLATLSRLLDHTDPASIDLRQDAFFLAAMTVHIGHRAVD
jgi:SAM-dependent methyltransferase